MYIHEKSLSELDIPLNLAERGEWNDVCKNFLIKSPVDFSGKTTYLQQFAHSPKLKNQHLTAPANFGMYFNYIIERILFKTNPNYFPLQSCA